MRLLLDTHAFLWFVMGDARLSAPARSAIEDAQNERLLSAASAWEMAIKLSIGKLTLRQPLKDFLTVQLASNRISLLPISVPHICLVPELPFIHRDPFDRLLIAQALVEQCVLVSVDAQIAQYPLERLW
jgi:PIN domain nuclease of toxin-antitoxin system